MESQDTSRDVSDFALANDQFLPSLEEMDKVAFAAKPIIARTKKLHRRWGMVIYGAVALGIIWSSIIINMIVQGTRADWHYGIIVALNALMGIIGTVFFGYFALYDGLRLYSKVISIDDEGITFWIYKNEKKRLRWQDLRWWQVYDFSDESAPHYCMYNFHPKAEHLGTAGYSWYEPSEANQRNQGVIGDRYAAFQQQMHLVRALIALHLGPPRGEPIESFALDEDYEPSQRA